MNQIKCIIIVFFNFLFLNCECQLKLISFGKQFEELQRVKMKIIQLNNGNTFSYLFKDKNHVEIQIYNKEHKLMVEKTISPSFAKLDACGYETFFEINGDLVIFDRNFDQGNIPMFTRVIVDINTGDIKKDEKLVELEKTSMGHAYDYTLYENDYDVNFLVRKNKFTDGYSLLISKGFSKDPSTEMEIVNYDKYHKELSRSFIPHDTEYKYSGILSYDFLNKDSIFILWKDFTLIKRDYKSKGFFQVYSILSNKFYPFDPNYKLEVGSTRFLLDKDNMNLYFFNSQNVTESNKIIQTTFVREYKCQLSVFDLERGEYSLKDKDVSSSTLFPSIFKDYKGVPQDIFFKKNGDLVIIYEEITLKDKGSKVAAHESHLKDIVVARFNSKLELIGSSFIPQHHRIEDRYLGVFFNNDSGDKPSYLSEDGSEYKYFGYINSSKGILLMNDLEKNEEKGSDGDPKMVLGLDESNGFYFNTSENRPQRQYVFGKSDDDTKNLGLFTTIDFNEQTNIGCMYKLSFKGRKDKQMSLVWFKVEE